MEAAPSDHLTISVISPSYNQAEYLPDCLASVRDQTYKPIEHCVFDPGSTDDSRAIAATFPHVTLIAEPDSGQSDALNKGFARVRGDIIAWVNSDDFYAHPKVFERVIERFRQPDAPDIVYGRGIYLNERGEKLRDAYINKDPSTLPLRFQHEDGILQPALFMRRSVIETIGELRADLHYSMDYEYWIRCMKAGIRFAYVDEDFAVARYHLSNKTYGMRGSSYAEVCEVMKEHFGYVHHIWLKRFAEFLAEGHDGVLATVANKGAGDRAKLDQIYCRLLLAYNAGFKGYEELAARADEKGCGDTLREMRRLGACPPVPCKRVAPGTDPVAGFTCYTVGPQRWAFEAKWKAKEIAKSHVFLRQQILRRRSDVCVIVGNGPSLNRTNLSLLERTDVIVSNNAFLSKELMGHATYYTVVNYLVAEQSAARINRLEGVHKVLPYWLAYCLNPGPNTRFVDAVGHAEFSRDMFKNMSWRHTVTFFNMHLAYGLGYRRVVMIGFDHNYSQPKNVVEQEIIESSEADANHFHPDYFRGKKWQAADVDMMEEMYRLAKEAFEEDGREIVNATVGGKLELFPRQTLEQALSPKTEAGIVKAEAFASAAR